MAPTQRITWLAPTTTASVMRWAVLVFTTCRIQKLGICFQFAHLSAMQHRKRFNLLHTQLLTHSPLKLRHQENSCAFIKKSFWAKLLIQVIPSLSESSQLQSNSSKSPSSKASDICMEPDLPFTSGQSTNALGRTELNYARMCWIWGYPGLIDPLFPAQDVLLKPKRALWCSLIPKSISMFNSRCFVSGSEEGDFETIQLCQKRADGTKGKMVITTAGVCLMQEV